MNTERFIGSVGIVAGGANNESFAELWNPAASGRILKVTFLYIKTASAFFAFKTHTAQQGSSGTLGSSGNKLLGSVNTPVGVLYGHTLLSVLGVAVTLAFDSVLEMYDFTDSPIIITPGHSLIIENNTANTNLDGVIVQWHEINANY